MKKIIKRSWLILVILISFCFNAYGITVTEIVNNVKQKEKQTENMSAILIETIYNKDTKITQSFEGNIILKKPDKIHLEFTKPLNQKIISNGKVIWIYIPELNQAMKQEITAKKIDDPILAVGKMLESFQKDYDITLKGSEKLENDDTYLLDLNPKKGNENLPNMKVNINKESWIPVKTDIIDAENSISIFFTNIKTNIKISNDIFEFKPAKDVEVIVSPIQITPE